MNTTIHYRKAEWLNNFYLHLGKYLNTFDISLATYDQLRKKSIIYKYITSEMEVLTPWAERKQAYAGFITEYEKMEVEIITYAKGLVQQLEESANFSSNIELELGIPTFNKLIEKIPGLGRTDTAQHTNRPAMAAVQGSSMPRLTII